MPSWNIHIAHVERLLSERTAEELGIADANTFLFGNYVPDIYIGYMVPGVSFHLDYLITHVAQVDLIPVPDADRFWDSYIAYRTPQTPAGMSLALGAWAHLVADRYYNGNFRAFWQTHETPAGDELRKRKQADFDLFGRSLRIASHVEITPELLEAAQGFCGYSILPADVAKSVNVASEIVRTNVPENAQCDHYQLLGAAWLEDVFDSCHERLRIWLETWQQLEAKGERPLSTLIRAEAGLPAATAFGKAVMSSDEKPPLVL